MRILNDNSGISLALNENNSSLKSYPFKFNIYLEIRLNLNSLEILAKVTNNSEIIMPFSFGLHPYFSVKDLSKVTISGLDSKCIDHITMSPSKTSMQINRLTNGVDFISSGPNKISLVDKIENMIIEMKTHSPFSNIVLWTDPPRQMVCMEPWTSPRNSLISGKDILKLPPGKTTEISCQFTLKT